MTHNVTISGQTGIRSRKAQADGPMLYELINSYAFWTCEHGNSAQLPPSMVELLVEAVDNGAGILVSFSDMQATGDVKKYADEMCPNTTVQPTELSADALESVNLMEYVPTDPEAYVAAPVVDPDAYDESADYPVQPEQSPAEVSSDESSPVTDELTVEPIEGGSEQG